MPAHMNRYQRSSLQELRIAVNEQKSDSTTEDRTDIIEKGAIARDSKLYKERSERRRRTFSLAQSNQIREIIAKTVEELSLKGSEKENHSNVQSIEDVLNKVLTVAKESGFSAVQIFNILGSTSTFDEISNKDEFISREKFMAGMHKLAKGIHRWRSNELEFIAQKFDVKGDGFISLAELHHYCYHEISSVAWRAERQRVMSIAQNDKSGNVKDTDLRFDIKDIHYSCGPVCHKTSKLFWKTNLCVGIIIYYCSELDVITIQIYNVSSQEDYKTLYVNKKDCNIDQNALKEATNIALQASHDKSAEGQDVIRRDTSWTYYSNYLIARLSMTKDESNNSGYIPHLIKLHGDTVSLEINKPEYMAEPERRSQKPNTSGKSLEDEFQSMFQACQRDSRSARTSRQSANELTNLVKIALDEIKVDMKEN